MADVTWHRMYWASLGLDAKKWLLDYARKKLYANMFKFHKGPHRIGTALVQNGLRSWSYAVIVMEDTVQLDPFPKEIEPAKEVSISGHLHPNMLNLSLSHFSSSRQATQTKLKVGEDRRFDVRFTTPKEPGRYVYELRARRRDPRSGVLSYETGQVAQFTLNVGLPAEKKPNLVQFKRKGHFEPDIGVPAFLASINVERVALGLRPLKQVDTANTLAKEIAIRAGKPNGFSQFKEADFLSDELQGRTEKPRVTWGWPRSIKRWVWRALTVPSLRMFYFNPDATELSIAFHNDPDSSGRPKWRYGAVTFSSSTKQK